MYIKNIVKKTLANIKTYDRHDFKNDFVMFRLEDVEFSNLRKH